MSRTDHTSVASDTALSGAVRYPHLFSPIRIGKLKLPTRFAIAPMTTNFANPDGSVSRSLQDYLVARARGGFSLIITENIGVHASGRVMPRMVMADTDDHIVGLTGLAKAIKAEGAHVIGQLSHAGRQTNSAVTGHPLVAPSAIPCPINRQMPQELDLDGIRQIEQAFVDAAVRLERSGFDGVELHGAHGYLLGAFLSLYSNKRTDEYGGTLENRMRFLLNVVGGIRRATSPDFVLTVRISALEFVAEGLELPESVAIVKRLADAGIDAISISVGVYESFNHLSMITGDPEGQWLDVAAHVKRHTSIPVFGVGRIKRPEVAEQALAEGQVDLPLFGRASIADPELPIKIAQGKDNQIIWCTSCNTCLGRSARPETICPVNPAVGREAAFNFTRVTTSKRVAIIGSSWAALTAGWIAAARGHQVTIYETESNIGGMQVWRAKVPGQTEFTEATEALLRRAQDAGAQIERRAPQANEYDLLWVVRRYQPLSSPATLSSRAAFTSYDVLAGAICHLQLPLTAVGQDLATAEAAVLLAEAGTRVEVWAPGRDIAVDAHPGYRESTRRRLSTLGVEVRTSKMPQAHQLLSALVVGQLASPARMDDNDAQWVIPYLTARPNAWLGDAYEPGLLTTTIYEAAAMAAAV